MCLAQGHNVVMPVGWNPHFFYQWSRFKHSTTEPQRSLCFGSEKSKIVNIFLPISFNINYVLGAQKNRLIETVLLSTTTNVMIEK